MGQQTSHCQNAGKTAFKASKQKISKNIPKNSPQSIKMPKHSQKKTALKASYLPSIKICLCHFSDSIMQPPRPSQVIVLTQCAAAKFGANSVYLCIFANLPDLVYALLACSSGLQSGFRNSNTAASCSSWRRTATSDDAALFPGQSVVTSVGPSWITTCCSAFLFFSELSVPAALIASNLSFLFCLRSTKQEPVAMEKFFEHLPQISLVITGELPWIFK